MRIAGLAIAVSLALAAGHAAARDLFVNNLAGDDHFNGRVAVSTQPGDGPVHSLAKALRLCDGADRVILANTGTPYHESVALMGDRHSGFRGQPFTIEGNGATLDGSSPVPADAWQNYRGDVFRFQPERMAYQQLFLDNLPARRHPAVSSLAGVPPLVPLQWTLHDGWVYFRVEPGRLPDSYHVSDADLQVGLTLYKVEYVLIENLIVEGYQLDGINCQDVHPPVTLANITAQGNGRSGIAVCGSSHVTIESCRLGANGESQLHVEGPGETRVERSELVGTATAPKWLADGSRLLIDGQPVK